MRFKIRIALSCIWSTSALLVAIAAALGASKAVAQENSPQGPGEFSLSVGYANLSVGSGGLIDGESALRFEPSLTFAPVQQLPQLRMGGDVGVTLVLDNSSRTVISGDHGLIFTGSSDIPVWFIEPEFRISWRQTLGDANQFFIEPGIAGGVAFGRMELDANDGSGDSYNANSNTAFGRVFLRAGARVTGGLAGFEASWLSGGQMDFGDNASGDFSEFYIGFFGALYF